MLRNITAIIFAVITLVAFLAKENMAHLMATLKSKSLKFGETLAVQTVGNPEPSPMWSERCRDLTGDNLKGLVKEKVGSVMKISGLNGSFSSSFNSLCSSKKKWFRQLNYMEYSKC